MTYLKIDGVSKFFNSKTNKHVLENISFSAKENSLTTIFGPNGCGKSTLFSIILGILEPDHGSALLKDRPSSHAKIGIMFQNYSDTLMPWKTCLDNIAFPLELQGIEKEKRRKLVREFVSELEIDIPLEQFPYQCSGGQKQLTAIARALIIKPDLLLLDEPFSALDYSTRIAMESKFLDIWTKVKTTTLIVSHDIEEAIFLGDRILVLTKSPSQIIGDITVDLPRPRQIKVVETEQFNQIKKNTIEAFLRGQQR